MQKRVYFVLGMVTSAIVIYLLIQKRWAEWTQAQSYETGVRDFNARDAEDRAARRDRLTPEQKIRLEMLKQEYRMQALEELDEEEEQKGNGKKKTGD